MLKRARLLGLSLVMFLTMSAGFIGLEAEPASAASGCNHDLCLFTTASQDTVFELRLQISPSFTGYHHVHVWMAQDTVEDYNTPDNYLYAGQHYTGTINLRQTEIGSIHRGETVCGELWLWQSGRWVSRGLPCITH